MPEFLYENPPLIEVVCEIRWELVRISSMPPEALIDPHFDLFKEDATKLADQKGYGISELVNPMEFPREFRPHMPEIRFRKRPNAWPLFQIGPGLFSANVTPPYGGWSKFRTTLRDCIETLLSSYPVSQKYMKISRIELRYINAFDRKYDYDNFYKFINEKLNVSITYPNNIFEQHASDISNIQGTNRLIIPIKKPNNSKLILGLSSGVANSLESLIAEITVREDKRKPKALNVTELTEWFDESHASISDIFENLLTENLKEKMGRPKEAKK